MVDDPNTLTRVTSAGVMEVDIHTGEIIRDPVEVVEKTYLPAPDYNLEDAERVLNMISSGSSVASIERQLIFPKNTIANWLRSHPDFKKKYLEARDLRAYTFEDKMVELVEDPNLTNENIKVADFRFKGYSKLASFGNKTEFGTKHVETTHSGGVNLIIETGIRRNHDQEKEIEYQDGGISSGTTSGQEKPAIIEASGDSCAETDEGDLQDSGE